MTAIYIGMKFKIIQKSISMFWLFYHQPTHKHIKGIFRQIKIHVITPFLIVYKY
jgi:hypothetical protein